MLHFYPKWHTITYVNESNKVVKAVDKGPKTVEICRNHQRGVFQSKVTTKYSQYCKNYLQYPINTILSNPKPLCRVTD